MAHNPGGLAARAGHATSRRSQDDPVWLRWTLITLAIGTLGLLVVVPVANVFYEAFSEGTLRYWKSLTADRETRHAIWLTMIVAPCAVIMNVIFGLAAAWAIARFRFFGRSLLTTLIDLPFAISPIVAGLMFMLLFGRQGYLGPWLKEYGIQLVFSLPGLILITAFVTLPFVARELIPVM